MMKQIFQLVVVLAIAISSAAGQPPPADQPPAASVKPESHGGGIPDTFTNLKVLPPDITKRQLMGVMRGFCVSTGVRCSHCHAVSDDLSTGSFASDEKEAKTQSRDLLRTILATRDDITHKTQ